MGGSNVVRAGDRVVPTNALKLWFENTARGRVA